MPSQGEDEGTMSVLPGLSCQHPRACRSSEDACSTSRSLGAAEPFTNTSRNKRPVPSFKMSFVRARSGKGKYS